MEVFFFSVMSMIIFFQILIYKAEKLIHPFPHFLSNSYSRKMSIAICIFWTYSCVCGSRSCLQEESDLGIMLIIFYGNLFHWFKTSGVVFRGQTCLTNLVAFYSAYISVQGKSDTSSVCKALAGFSATSKLEREEFYGQTVWWMRNWLKSCIQNVVVNGSMSQ